MEFEKSYVLGVGGCLVGKGEWGRARGWSDGNEMQVGFGFLFGVFQENLLIPVPFDRNIDALVSNR